MGVQAEEWHFVGLESSFPDISQDEKGCRVLPGCKTLGIPKPTQPDKPKTNRVSNLDEQVLVFKYKGSVHAVDNRCPHSAFPLKQGTIIDVEDFGPGIKCFRHGWSFDLTTGKADRGHHLKLNLWDIELRDPLISSDESVAGDDKEVWVKRR